MKILAALMLAIATFGTASAQNQPAPPSVLVRTVPARQGSLTVTVRAFGLVRAAPGATLDISMPRAGRVSDLRVLAGQRVAAGAPLFDFAAEPVDLLAYQQAQSALTLARQDRTHAASLFGQRLATQSQLDQADKAVHDAEAQIAMLRQLGGAQPAQRVAAPFSGLVAAVTATNGAHVAANATILQLVEEGRLEAVLGVPAEDGARLAAGLPARLAALSAPGDPIEGRIASVSAQLDPKTQLVDIVVPVSPADPAPALLVGEHVSAEIAAGKLTGWIVPRPAVLIDKSGPYLFQAANGKARRVALGIVGEAGAGMAVEGALDPALPIVISGNYELTDGMAVRQEAPASSPPAGSQTSLRR